jgi:hypothetical protein
MPYLSNSIMNVSIFFYWLVGLEDAFKDYSVRRSLEDTEG